MTKEELELRLYELVKANQDALEGDAFLYQFVPMIHVEEMEIEELIDRLGATSAVHLGRMTEAEFEERAWRRYGDLVEQGGRMETPPEQPDGQPEEETPEEAPAEGEPTEAPAEGEDTPEEPAAS